jgi:hypothetical protein
MVINVATNSGRHAKKAKRQQFTVKQIQVQVGFPSLRQSVARG